MTQFGSSEELREACEAWSKYIDRLTKDCVRDPRLKEYLFLALLRRAAAYATLKEWDAAIADCTRLIEEKADQEKVRVARMLLGGIYTDLECDQEAIECWSLLLSENERSASRPVAQRAQLYLYRGMLYGRQKQYRQAIADLDRAEHDAADDAVRAEVYSVRGISYGYLGDLDRARSECLRAVELATNASFYHRLGEVYFMRHEYRQSFDAFDRAWQLDPDDETIQLNRNKAMFYQTLSIFDHPREDGANNG